MSVNRATFGFVLRALFSRRGMLILVFAGLAWLVLTVGNSRLLQSALLETAIRGENTLRLAISGLRGEVAQFERLPRFLAQQELLADAARAGASAQTLAEANQYLYEVNALLGSSDLYVVRPDGQTVAASNFRQDLSFVGQNFIYRPYVTDALKGGDGRFFALGTTSRKRGYYFGAPISRDGDVLGVLVLKMDIDMLEDSWRAADYEIIVTDPEGIIFMASRRAWHFSTLEALTEEMRARVAATRRYDLNPLPALPLEAAGTFEAHPLLRLKTADGVREFMMLSEHMPDASWTVSMLMDTATAHQQARVSTLAALLAVGLTMLGLAVFLQRRARLRERMVLQREAHAQLERRVEERTRQLAGLNVRLQEEVSERRATEVELRRTQSRLVQSGKLMALGQMSAALSHEFNQPLAALRNFADNAVAYIDRGRVPEARENISRILGLANRMRDISRTLSNFARNADQKLTPVHIQQAWNETYEILLWAQRYTHVRLEVSFGSSPLYVQADPVRFQQVLVNLVTNAIDMLDGRDDGFVHISAVGQDDKVLICVADNGPGIAPGMRERIFDPFFTTKSVGRGLGLGLSISYNIIKDFRGDLRVQDAKGGGALFIMELPRANRAEPGCSVSPDPRGGTGHEA